MNVLDWIKKPTFEGEFETGGGEAPAPAEEQSPTAALEARLARLQGTVDQQNQQAQTQAQQNRIAQQYGQLKNNEAAAIKAVEVAEANLATAYDDGEGLDIAKAQRALTEAVAKRERANIGVENFEAQVKQAQSRPPAGEAKDTSNLDAWKTKHNTWYGVDAAMTKASHEIDRQIREAGVYSVGSKEYFDKVDQLMSARYPDKFGGTPPTAGNSMPGAPNTQRKGRISQSIAEGWRRMGINMSDPKTVERMISNREKLVQKGILPEQPVSGGIINR